MSTPTAYFSPDKRDDELFNVLRWNPHGSFSTMDEEENITPDAEQEEIKRYRIAVQNHNEPGVYDETIGILDEMIQDSVAPLDQPSTPPDPTQLQTIVTDADVQKAIVEIGKDPLYHPAEDLEERPTKEIEVEQDGDAGEDRSLSLRAEKKRQKKERRESRKARKRARNKFLDTMAEVSGEDESEGQVEDEDENDDWDHDDPWIDNDSSVEMELEDDAEKNSSSTKTRMPTHKISLSEYRAAQSDLDRMEDVATGKIIDAKHARRQEKKKRKLEREETRKKRASKSREESPSKRPRISLTNARRKTVVFAKEADHRIIPVDDSHAQDNVRNHATKSLSNPTPRINVDATESDATDYLMEIIKNPKSHWDQYQTLYAECQKDFLDRSENYRTSIKIDDDDIERTIKMLFTLAEKMFLPNARTKQHGMIEKEQGDNMTSNAYKIEKIDAVRNWNAQFPLMYEKMKQTSATHLEHARKQDPAMMYPFSRILDVSDHLESFSHMEVIIRESGRYLCSFTGRTLQKGEQVYLLKIWTYDREDCKPGHFYISKPEDFPYLYLGQTYAWIMYRWQRSKFIVRLAKWRDGKKFGDSVPGYKRLEGLLKKDEIEFLKALICEYAGFKTLATNFVNKA